MSRSPRSSMTRLRRASSSRPRASSCSSFNWVVVMGGPLGLRLEVEGDVAGRGRDTELDVLVLGAGDLARAQVPDSSGGLAAGAGVADAHAAAEGRRQAGRLGLLEQGAGGQRSAAAGAEEVQGPRPWLGGLEKGAGWGERLGQQPVGREELRRRVEQLRRPANRGVTA